MFDIQDTRFDGDYDYDQIMAGAPEEPECDLTTFDFPGPVAAAFAQCDALVKCIMGPMGSAKTSTCFFDILIDAVQLPYMKNGERVMKALVLRDTYRNLYKTTIASWWEWFPPKWGDWSGGQDRPARHEITFEDDYGVVRLIVDFEAVGEQGLEQFFKGRGFIKLYLNEGDGFSRDIISWGVGRLGRFPKKDQLKDPSVPLKVQVSIDCNAPDTDSWIYEEFIENADKNGYQFFRQPGAREPGAENMENLRTGYYDDMIASNPAWWVKRNVDNEFGFSREGEPVFNEEFVDSFHIADRVLEAVAGLPIDLGVDAGGHPAAVFRQFMPDGQRRILAQIVNKAGGVGPLRFAEQIDQVMMELFPGFEFSDDLWGDPSAFFGGDKERGDLHWARTVSNHLGIQIKPAPSNEVHIRLEAVRQPLLGRIDGNRPEILVSPRCKNLRKGFNSGYKYRRDKQNNVHVDIPVKLGGFSDDQDALQYVELGHTGLNVVTGQNSARLRRQQQQQQRRQGRRQPSRGGSRSVGFDPFA